MNHVVTFKETVITGQMLAHTLRVKTLRPIFFQRTNGRVPHTHTRKNAQSPIDENVLFI